jgi:hypothetical protein
MVGRRKLLSIMPSRADVVPEVVVAIVVVVDVVVVVAWGCVIDAALMPPP